MPQTRVKCCMCLCVTCYSIKIFSHQLNMSVCQSVQFLVFSHYLGCFLSVFFWLEIVGDFQFFFYFVFAHVQIVLVYMFVFVWGNVCLYVCLVVFLPVCLHFNTYKHTNTFNRMSVHLFVYCLLLVFNILAFS